MRRAKKLKVVDIGKKFPNEKMIKLKAEAVEMLNETDNFVLIRKLPGIDEYQWISCNVSIADLVLMGNLLTDDGLQGFREIDNEE